MTMIAPSREVIVIIPPGTDDWMVDALTDVAFTDAWLAEQVDRLDDVSRDADDGARFAT